MFLLFPAFFHFLVVYGLLLFFVATRLEMADPVFCKYPCFLTLSATVKEFYYQKRYSVSFYCIAFLGKKWPYLRA